MVRRTCVGALTITLLGLPSDSLHLALRCDQLLRNVLLERGFVQDDVLDVLHRLLCVMSHPHATKSLW